MKRWTTQEEYFLKKFYPKKGAEYCAEKLNRSIKSIRQKSSRLGLNMLQRGQKDPTNYYKYLSSSEYEALEEYKGSPEKILHRHINCGFKWKVSPNNLRKLRGCPNCSYSGFKASKITYLYLVHFSALDLYKIGITTNWEKRKYDFGYEPTLLEIEKFNSGIEAKEEEKRLLKSLSKYMYNSGELKAGNTETFICP